jgi:hypothetical protein
LSSFPTNLAELIHAAGEALHGVIYEPIDSIFDKKELP